MKKTFRTDLAWVAASVLALLGGACRPAPSAHWQGYIEAELVYVASPVPGQIEDLAVKRGDQIAARTNLFTLESAAEQAAKQEAASRVVAARARLADLRQGLRPSEITALESRLAQTRSAAELSRLELARQEELHLSGVNSTETYDRARLTHERNLNAVEELTAQLETARLGGREDAIAAAAAEVDAAEAALARAEWNVAQKTQAAPQAGLVYDTLYRAGEYVPVARPIVALLPPENLKVRFFVPETVYGTLQAGDSIMVTIDGRDSPVSARITYLSPQPEYTPPVLYNRENRSKLVFMVEGVFAAADAAGLHPGQPVDVEPATKP